MAWREQVARERRAAFADQEYWGRPVPGFGAAEPAVWIVGLAPAAHGANRTGRMFTGDRSGDWLFASLHRVGLAAIPTSASREDGQALRRVRLTAAVHCAPPDNKPTPVERDTCAPWIAAELLSLPTVRVVVALGSFGWDGAVRSLVAAGARAPAKRPKFGHGAELALGDVTLLGCFHPSPHNTYTGRLTREMTDAVFESARALTG